MDHALPQLPEIPESCPFTIDHIKLNGLNDSRSYLIREHDQYGEFPHIYAKVCRASQAPSTNGPFYNRSSYSSSSSGRPLANRPEEIRRVIVLSDTGCGTTVANTSFSKQPFSAEDGSASSQPAVWDICTFLEYTINPGGHMPYLVMTTHCHFDHIMGLEKLPPTSGTSPRGRPPTTVLTSSHAKAFVSPYANLQKSSLCGQVGLRAPSYSVGIWAEDMSTVVFTPSSSSGHSTSSASIPTPYTILHTPGHTPDSLSWYDAELRLLCVGDSFYAKETSITKQASEPPMPVIFPSEGNLEQWWDSLEKILDFVTAQNEDGAGKRGIQLEALETQCAQMSMEMNARVGKQRNEENEDEGFVLVDADETLDEGPGKSSQLTGSKQSSSSPYTPVRPFPLASRQKVTSPSKSQKQTGFDIPPVGQRGHMVLPTTSASTLLKPAITPTQVGRLPDTLLSLPTKDLSPEAIRSLQVPSSLANPDPWMLVLDLDKRPRSSQVHRPPQKPSSKGPPISPGFSALLTNTTSYQRPSNRRVKLCAAHTTLAIDAEKALTSMRSFMARVLRNQVPCKKVDDGSIRGEEFWLWDYDIDTPNARELERARRQKGVEFRHPLEGDILSSFAKVHGMEQFGYSLLAPLRLVEEGRRRICLDGLEDQDAGREGWGSGRARTPAGVV